MPVKKKPRTPTKNRIKVVEVRYEHGEPYNVPGLGVCCHTIIIARDYDGKIWQHYDLIPGHVMRGGKPAFNNEQNMEAERRVRLTTKFGSIDPLYWTPVRDPFKPKKK